MKTLTTLFLLLALLYSCDAASKRKSSTSKKTDSSSSNVDVTSKKISSIMKAVSFNPVISLFDSNFTKFVADRPRDYHAILMFTATAPQFQCGVCTKSAISYNEIATFYNKQFVFNTTAPENRIAFFKIEVDDGRGIFNELGLETVPRVYILPPTPAGAPKMKISNFEIDNRILLEGTSRIIEELNNMTGVKIEVTVDPAPLTLLVGAIAILVALFVAAAQGDLYNAVLWYQSPKIWVFVSAICFAVGVSGSIFCVIKSSPLFGMGRRGISIFATQGREQYLLEGVLIAFMTLLSALAAYFMNIATKLRYPLLRHIVVILALAIWIVLGYYIFTTYRMKTGWYQLKDTFPPAVWSWMSASVKKSSTLPKRMWRLAEIWLFEAKDLAGFYKKFQALVVDYIAAQMKAAAK